MAETDVHRLERECTELLFEQSKSGIVVNLLAALLLGALLWGSVPPLLLGSWLLLILVLSAARGALAFAFGRVRDEAAVKRWRWYFVVTAGVVGLSWGTGAAVFYGYAMQVEQLVIALVIGGFAVMALPYLAPVFTAYAVFDATLLGSFAAGFLARGDRASMILAAIIAVILPALLMLAHIYRRKLRESLLLARRNAALVEELSANREMLETRVAQRTEALHDANREMESFNYSVSHDLRAPLRAIDGYGSLLLQDYGPQLDEQAQHMIERLRAATRRMDELIDALLRLSRVSRGELACQAVDLSQLAEQVARRLESNEPQRHVRWRVAPGMSANGDRRLLQIVLENLLANAWKYTRNNPDAQVEVGATQARGDLAYFVRDNGAGFDQRFAHKLFGAFQRLHDDHEFEGTGIGLATVDRIVRRHGGEVWAQSAGGATFYFTLGGGAAGDVEAAAG